MRVNKNDEVKPISPATLTVFLDHLERNFSMQAISLTLLFSLVLVCFCVSKCIGKECCRNIALDRCMKQRVPRECQSLATNWLSPELRNWIYTACNNFNERRCEELLFHCNRQREERIADCTRIGQKTWSGESLKDRCCLSHNVEKCLKTRNIDECYDNSYSLATYLSQSRDYRLRQSCDEFTDISACEDNTWTIILLGILVLVLAIVLIVLCVFLVLYCLKRRRTK